MKIRSIYEHLRFQTKQQLEILHDSDCRNVSEE